MRTLASNSHYQDMIGFYDAGRNSGMVRKELKLFGLDNFFAQSFKKVGASLGFVALDPLSEGNKLVPEILKALLASGWLGAYIWSAAKEAKGLFLAMSEAELISNTTQKLTKAMV